MHRTRRDLLLNVRSLGAAALAALLAEEGTAGTAQAAADDSAPKTTHHPPKAKSVIWLHMYGAPSHVDLFDYKPELERLAGKPVPESYAFTDSTTDGGVGTLMPPKRPFRRRGQSGLWVSDFYPNISGLADDLTMLYSCHVLGTTHPVSLSHLHTGAPVGGRPSLGAWVSYGLGSANRNLPTYVVMTDDKGSVGDTSYWSSGFLPASYQATKFRRDSSPILHLARPASIGDQQQRAGLDFLQQINRHHASRRVADDELEARIESYELAYRMQSAAPEAVDFNKESTATRKLYGMDEEITRTMGTNCLLARRLVERGVRFVQIYCGSDAGWDAHNDLDENHTRMCKISDQPIAGLLTDLKARGLLDSTLVVWAGEFGRTPFSQQGRGRDHNPWGFTTWFAGGGSRRGHTVGATDEIGLRAVDNRIDPHDLHATILHLLGLDHLKVTYFHNGRAERATVTGGRVVQEAIA